MSSNFGSNNNTQEVELNITPIIDCFTVLITFLLASASFLSIGFLEASTPGTSVDPQAVEPDTEAMIKIKGNHTALFNVKGKRSLSMTFNLSDPENMKGLSQQVQKLADEHVQVGQVLISAEDDVDYKAVADVMGQLNDSKIPVVMGEF